MGEGGWRLGFKGAAPQPSPPPYIGVRGLWGASQTHLGQAKGRSEEHTSELQSHYSISYAVFCLGDKFPPLAGPRWVWDAPHSPLTPI